MKIQRAPRSIVSLLGAVGAQPPSEFLDQQRGVIEMLDLTVHELVMGQSNTVDAAAVTGSSVDIDVPQGQIWWLLGLQVSIVAAAVTVSNTLEASVRFDGKGIIAAQASHVLGSTLPPTPAAVNDHNCFYIPSRPTLLTPGDSVRGLLRSTDAAGAQLLACVVTYRRVDV